MPTLLTDDPTEAAALLRRGAVVAFPTETVYGLGADALDPEAVRRIFEAKGRPADNPLIVHLAAADQLGAVVRRVPAIALPLLEAFVPGPLTLILPRSDAVPDAVTAGLDTVGVRVPAHPVAHAFLAACDRPVAAPSANRSGRPSPTSWQAVRADLDGRIAAILRGARSDVGLESTVVDCTGEVPVVLRAGAVTLEALRAAVPGTRHHRGEGEAVRRSPGTRYRHYAPEARVQIVATPPASGDAETAYIGLEAPADAASYGHLLVCPDVAAYAHALFAFFRSSDGRGCTRILAQHVADEGLGVALNDRLRRAAEG